jgi:hypothetical protein
MTTIATSAAHPETSSPASPPTVAGVLVHACLPARAEARGRVANPSTSTVRCSAGTGREQPWPQGRRTIICPPTTRQGRGPSPVSQHLAPDLSPIGPPRTLASRRATRRVSPRSSRPRPLRVPRSAVTGSSPLARPAVLPDPRFGAPPATRSGAAVAKDVRAATCSAATTRAGAANRVLFLDTGSRSRPNNPSGDPRNPISRNTRYSIHRPQKRPPARISPARRGHPSPDRAFPTGHSVRRPTTQDAPCRGARALPPRHGRQASDRVPAVLGPTPGSRSRRHIPVASAGADDSPQPSQPARLRRPRTATAWAGTQRPRGPGQTPELPTGHSHGGDGRRRASLSQPPTESRRRPPTTPATNNAAHRETRSTSEHP